MKISASHRFENRHYVLSDTEVAKLNQILSFYHSSWINIPDFEKVKVMDLDTSEEVEIPVNRLIFQKEKRAVPELLDDPSVPAKS